MFDNYSVIGYYTVWQASSMPTQKPVGTQGVWQQNFEMSSCQCAQLSSLTFIDRAAEAKWPPKKMLSSLFHKTIRRIRSTFIQLYAKSAQSFKAFSTNSHIIIIGYYIGKNIFLYRYYYWEKKFKNRKIGCLQNYIDLLFIKYIFSEILI